MKRYGYLYDQAFSRENLFAAYKDAARHKHGKRACYNFEKRLAFNLDRLHTALNDGTYRPQPYYTFMVYEPKPRRIYAPAFSDLVVQHAIYRVIYPIFNPTLIEQSFACRVGKGTHKAADYAQKALQACRPGAYTIKLDIRKFFYRIDRAVLRAQIERKIKDRRFVDLLMVFAEYGEPVGIPIGNLLSQLYALIYLDPLDRFVKRELKVRRYCRYVDDFILFDLTREQCVEYQARIEAFIRDELHLELSKFTIAPVARGINFVGYRTWASKRFIRKHSLFKFHRAMRRDRLESVVSILGHARRTHSLKNLIAAIKEKNHALYCQLPKAYRQPAHC
jgi:retron-type reverse transcriptase